MWNGKKKAVTFSYDDGIEEDIRLVELFSRYQVKGTFNLNSGIQTGANTFIEKRSGITVRRMNQKGLRHLYRGQEIASHGLTHANPTLLDMESLYNEIAADKRNLEALFETRIVGYAYPFGCYNDDTVQMLKECGISYARTVETTEGFELQSDLLRFKASFHHNDAGIIDGIRRFLETETDAPQLLYIWGHSYEFDAFNNWEHMEEILKLVSGHDDVYYGTNSQVLLGEDCAIVD